MLQRSVFYPQLSTIIDGSKFFSQSFDTTTNVPALTFLCMQVCLEKHAEKINNPEFSGYREVFDRHTKLVAHRDELIKQVFRTMIRVGAYVFGGYLRDMVTGTKFNDIDIRVNSETEIQIFIAEILEFADIFKESKNIYPCFTCTNIRIQSRYQRNVWLDIDLTMDTVFTSNSFDFDVNMLKSTRPGKSLELINNQCNINDIFKNIMQKKFIILDDLGQPSYQHEIPSYYPIAKKTVAEILGLFQTLPK